MKLKYFALGLIIIIFDQITKFLFINKNFVIIPYFLNFTYTENKGGAFGIGDINMVLLLSIIIIVAIIIFMIINKKNIINFYPFVLLLSGSMSNLVDRIFRGYVIDFIDVNIFNFPNFNIADICIVIGIISFCVLEIIKINSKKENK